MAWDTFSQQQVGHLWRLATHCAEENYAQTSLETLVEVKAKPLVVENEEALDN